ncbi:MAG: serine hydrolase domain-containing protein [Pseudomonadota bacterium]
MFKYLLFTFSFISTTHLFAGEITRTPPDTVGLSPERLARLNPVMQAYIDEEKLVGIVTLVARKGKIAHSAAFGKQSLAAGKPMTENTIFRIYSMSKPITSVAVMMLYEQNKLQLTDPVSKYIPAFKQLMVYVGQTDSGEIQLVKPKREITVYDLLTHTSGLTYGFHQGTPVDKFYQESGVGAYQMHAQNRDLAEWIKKLAKAPLLFQPGERWHYGVSTDVLGYLVEVVSGMSLEQYLEQEIFAPLGMVDTGFYVPAKGHERFAAIYNLKDGRLNEITATSATRFYKPATFFSGGAGLVSTTRDYLRFCQMMLNDGALDGVRLLGRKSVELMRINHLSNETLANTVPSFPGAIGDKGAGFGLGFGVKTGVVATRRLGSLGEYSWGGAAGTIFWIDPIEKLIVIGMIQMRPSDFYPLREDMSTLVYQALVD